MPRTPTPTPGRPNVALIVTQAVTARTRGRGRRSPLYLWFRENHDEIAAVFDRSAPSWAKLAEVLGTNGVLDGDGKAPTARGARGAWARVRADVKKSRERREPAATRQAKPVPAIEMVAAEPEADAWGQEFQVAKAPVVAAAPIPLKPRLAPVQERRNPDEVIASLLARPRQGSIPMPPVPEPEED